MIKELICIRCPNGCHLRIDTDSDYTVSGNKCEKGAEYGVQELTHPVRVVTSTVRIEGAPHPRLPVKTDKPIDRNRITDVMALLDGVCVYPPIKVGDVILPCILGTDVNIVACKTAVGG